MTSNSIATHRKRLNISQKQLAAVMPEGVTNLAVHFIESGNAMPNVETMRAMCDLFHCQPTDIYEPDDLNIALLKRSTPDEDDQSAAIDITMPKKNGASNRGPGHDGMTEFRVWVKEEEKAIMDSALQRLGYRSSAEWFREQYRFLIRQYQTALQFETR